MNEKQDITPQSSFKKLEQRLVLPAWLNDQFGYGNNRDLLADMKGNGYFNARPYLVIDMAIQGE